MSYFSNVLSSLISVCVLIPLLIIPAVDSLLTEVDKNQIFSMIALTQRCHHIPGIALSIVSRKEGSLVEKGFGYEDVFSKSEVTERSLFPIGSTTKAFTSSLLAILMQKHEN